MNTSAFAANLEVSKPFAIVTIYGGFQIESSSVDINYNYLPEANQDVPNPKPIPILFSMNGKNKFREILGVSSGLGALTINAYYNIGLINVVSTGLGLSL